ncbi:hypothetical protein GCM10023238_39440 [Streptomyces heliomycini]
MLELPVGLALAWVASAVIFRWSPRRTQPGYTWLAFGSAVHLLLWVAATWLLALYVEGSGAFGTLYGPLTAFIALLLWAYLTAVALFLGIAFAAQLEAARAGVDAAVLPGSGTGLLTGRAKTSVRKWAWRLRVVGVRLHNDRKRRSTPRRAG